VLKLIKNTFPTTPISKYLTPPHCSKEKAEGLVSFFAPVLSYLQLLSKHLLVEL